MVNRSGASLLENAIENGQVRIVELLMQAGAISEIGTLFKSIISGMEETVKILLESGTDPHTSDAEGRNALHVAVLT